MSYPHHGTRALPLRTACWLLPLVLGVHWALWRSFAPGPLKFAPAALAPFQVRVLESRALEAGLQARSEDTHAASKAATASPSPSPSPALSTQPPSPALTAAHTFAAPLASTATTIRGDSLPTLIPPARQLTYRVNGTLRGQAYTTLSELRWQHDGKQYEVQLALGERPAGARVQTSTGLLATQGLAPVRFGERGVGDKTRSEVATHFERTKNKIIFSGNTREAALQSGAQDRLSLLIQLASLLAANASSSSSSNSSSATPSNATRFQNGSVIELQTAGTREAQVWQFVVEGEVLLSLPPGDSTSATQGAITVIKLTRPAQQTYDTTVELWLAPRLGYLPARIRTTQTNGDYVDHLLRD